MAGITTIRIENQRIAVYTKLTITKTNILRGEKELTESPLNKISKLIKLKKNLETILNPSLSPTLATR